MTKPAQVLKARSLPDACGCEMLVPDGARPMWFKCPLHDSASDLLAALTRTLPLLVRLGDFIANDDGRCEVILAAKDAIARAEKS